MNKILEFVLQARQGHYVHALEVSDVYELESCLESLYSEFVEEYGLPELIDFCTSLELYCLDDDDLSEELNSLKGEQVYNFNIEEFLNNL